MRDIKIIFAVIIGNAFEWYDFSLYGYLVPVITKVFFPHINHEIAIVIAFAVFATGFIARPLGSLFFGYYGDKKGRKSSLLSSLLLMTASTFLMGSLPSYQAVGIISIALLILCRLSQGFAVGGEFTTSITYVIELAPHDKKALWGSFTMFGTFMGLLCGSLSIVMLHFIFSDFEILHYAWRIPFLIAALVGLLGLIIRKKLPETAVFEALITKQQILHNPMVVIKNNYNNILIAIGLLCFSSVSFCLWFVWLPSYLKMHTNLASSQIFLINTINLFVVTLMIPFIGFLTDKLNNKRIMLYFSAISSLAIIIPMLALMSKFTFLSILFAQLIIVATAIVSTGVIPVVLFDLFEPNVRCTGIGISYNTANMILGATAPLFASLIATKSPNLIYQSSMVIFTTLIVIILTPKIRNMRS